MKAPPAAAVTQATARAVNASRFENMAAYLAYTNSTAAAIRKGSPVVYDPDQVIPVKGLADIERVHRENGRTAYKTPIDLKKVVDTKFVDEARAVLGKYKK